MLRFWQTCRLGGGREDSLPSSNSQHPAGQLCVQLCVHQHQPPSGFRGRGCPTSRRGPRAPQEGVMLGPSSTGDGGALLTSGPRPKGSLTQGHALAGCVGRHCGQPVCPDGTGLHQRADSSKHWACHPASWSLGVPRPEAKGSPQGV